MWEYNTKIFGDIETMNSALVDRFLSLISLIFKSNYEEYRMSNPEESFRDCVQYFINHFGATIENKQEANKEMMKAEWGIHQEWEALKKQIEDDITYASFAQHLIPDKEVVDIAMKVIMHTGLFANQYEE